jgi:hypothetical protein
LRHAIVKTDFRLGVDPAGSIEHPTQTNGGMFVVLCARFPLIDAKNQRVCHEFMYYLLAKSIRT